MNSDISVTKLILFYYHLPISDCYTLHMAIKNHFIVAIANENHVKLA